MAYTYIEIPYPGNNQRLHTILQTIPQLIGENGTPLYTIERHPNNKAWLVIPDSIDKQIISNAIVGYDPTPDPEVEKLDLGADIPEDQGTRMAQAAQVLRTYLGVATPTAAQSAAALKVLIRVVLYVLKHRLGF